MMSMTAYANVEENIENYLITCEIKSLNNRFLHIDTELPQNLNPFEIKIKKLLGDKIKRGKIKVKIKIQDSNIDHIDPKLAKEYIETFKKIAGENNISDDIKISDIILAAKTLKPNTTRNNYANFDKIKPTFCSTLDKLIEEKIREGTDTKNNIAFLIKNINQNLKKIKALVPLNKEKALNKIKKHIEDNIKIFEQNIDQEKIWTELTILLINKIDINEEIERLSYHIKNFENLINEEKPLGKKLDFLLQEMLRETNTISAKANNIDIINLGIEIKTFIEQSKEQIQNIE